ncbi:hypothetical protein LTR17_025679 [Elasticomyces elasticus]|nr:hypothetical protein LTR17_025679 [Elasticomyces elasticus]
MRNRSGLDKKDAERKSAATTDPSPQALTQQSAAPATYQSQSLTTADTTVYQVHVKVFMVSTGDDSGSECELIGWISFPGTDQILNFEVNLPVKTFFGAENDGLGRLVAEFSGSKVSEPKSFQAFVDEHDIGGLDHILGNVTYILWEDVWLIGKIDAYYTRYRNVYDVEYICFPYYGSGPRLQKAVG